MQTDIHFLSNLAHFFLELGIYQRKVVKKIKTHVFYQKTFIENSEVYKNM